MLDQTPTNLDNSEMHPVVSNVFHYFKYHGWIKDVRIRMREAGEVFIIPESSNYLLDKMEQATEDVKKLDWKIYDVLITPVKQFNQEQDETQ